MTRAFHKEFEDQTGLRVFVAPVCHGERGFYSDEYGLWLEKELDKAEEKARTARSSALEEAAKICDGIGTEPTPSHDTFFDGRSSGADSCSQAIRSLKEREEEKARAARFFTLKEAAKWIDVVKEIEKEIRSLKGKEK